MSASVSVHKREGINIAQGNIFVAVRNGLGEQRTASHQLSDAMTLRRYSSVPLSLPFFVEVIASATGFPLRHLSLKLRNEEFDPIRDRTGQLKLQRIVRISTSQFSKMYSGGLEPTYRRESTQASLSPALQSALRLHPNARVARPRNCSPRFRVQSG